MGQEKLMSSAVSAPTGLISLSGGPRSLTSVVYARLRREIVTAHRIPGERLRPAKLQADFGVSLSIVREALSRLVADGLVQSVDQIGFRVAPASYEDMIDVATTRIEVEVLALGKSLVRGDTAWENRVRETGETLIAITPRKLDASTEEYERYAEADYVFHTAIVAACGSPWLLRFRDALYEQVLRYCSLARVLRLSSHADTDREHYTLMSAALARDIEQSIAIVTSHYSRIAQRVATVLRDTPPEGTSVRKLESG